jgi:hypothetical protein
VSIEIEVSIANTTVSIFSLRREGRYRPDPM